MCSVLSYLAPPILVRTASSSDAFYTAIYVHDNVLATGGSQSERLENRTNVSFGRRGGSPVWTVFFGGSTCALERVYGGVSWWLSHIMGTYLQCNNILDHKAWLSHFTKVTGGSHSERRENRTKVCFGRRGGSPVWTVFFWGALAPLRGSMVVFPDGYHTLWAPISNVTTS